MSPTSPSRRGGPESPPPLCIRLHRYLSPILAGLLALCFAQAPAAGEDRSHYLFQYSTIDSLVQGVYDGDLSFGELGRQGDFALGTVNGLDGEMIGLDGRFYQVRSNGRAYPIAPETLSPFAVAVFFAPDRSAPLPTGLSLAALERHVDGLMDNRSHYHALRIRGTFPYVKVRSVPAQTPPYRPLTEVVKEQAVFEEHDVSGTLIGFYMPGFMQGLNVVGYHLHFLTDDRARGGHVLALETGAGRIEIEAIDRLRLALPDTRAFAGLPNILDNTDPVRRIEHSRVDAIDEPRR